MTIHKTIVDFDVSNDFVVDFDVLKSKKETKKEAEDYSSKKDKKQELEVVLEIYKI